MRDTYAMKWDAINFEMGFDVSESDEWNTYESEDLENDMEIE